VKHDFHTKTVSAGRAIQAIKSGDRVLLEGSLSEPVPLIEALVHERDRFAGVEVITASPMESLRLIEKDMTSHFRLKTFFARGAGGKNIQSERADYIPVSLWGMVKTIQERVLPIDVALVQVSPPDASGNCSLGINVSYVKPAVEAARTVIAELNDQMPRTTGDAAIPLEKIDWICESSRRLPIIETPDFGKEEIQIAKGVAELIPSGATIEVGIGTIPDAILKALTEKEDLGLHSGMISDSMMELILKGTITNRNKTLDRGKSVASMAMGTQQLYRWIHENQSVSFHPSTYTHSVATISKIDCFIAINSGLQVDLTGQVNAEAVGNMIISGIGGGLDFAQGASHSKGGISVIALRSTADGDQASRIVSRLAEGAPVTYHRGNVDYVVTEYGVADLRGRSLEERADTLINLAHPKFRDELHNKKKKPQGMSLEGLKKPTRGGETHES
jgi:4-hydroxybutyrate CoA-transferase